MAIAIHELGQHPKYHRTGPNRLLLNTGERLSLQPLKVASGKGWIQNHVGKEIYGLVEVLPERR